MPGCAVAKWIVACRREDKINLKNACICSEHFETSSFEVPLRERLLNYTFKNSRHLKSDAVPTLKLPGNNDQQQNKRNMQERSNRLAKRMRGGVINDLLKENVPETIVSDAVLIDPNHNNTEVNNAKTNNEKVDLALELKKAQDEIQKLKEKLKTAENNQTDMSKKINYYNEILATVFTEGQMKKLLCPDKLKKVHWSLDDIASAVSLGSVSPKAYRYLLCPH